ncbi:PAAR-like domain-containing protein [Vibrio intestinalis]|uniref:PAAR-like domain-containing protein n=1 Tax=Vibrio intestinalis TaxID=2933291 RepID=UPI0021A290A1|nr:PAAR-like domain-containing protein [Vibrio intestinalis]
MAVTIAANGLSIVHKGSGSEANATLPDVCLTTVGPPVVPIPYGNNAKSADLVDGSTSVSADGGNSIALKGSKFSKSTGDAGGDKKGVSSGTIEAEAEFTSASADVLIEGKGVARLSDQMTMNAGNTMCLSGVQTPPVNVDEDLESTDVVAISVRYPNGQRLTNASYTLTDERGEAVASGVLDGSGNSTTVELKPGKVKIIVQESKDDYVVTPIRRANPHYAESMADDAFFDIASKGRRGFWQPTRIDTLGTPWGSIGQSLSEDKFFQDIVEAEVKLHFTHFHPESVFDFSKTCDVLVGNLNQPLPHTTEALLAYTLPIVLEEGELLSVLLRLAPYENTDRMLAYMRARGKGNPQAYLSNYNWQAAKKTIDETFESLLDKIKSRIIFLRDEANKLQYSYLSQDIFDKHINTLNTYMKGLPELTSGTFTKLQTKASLLLANTTNVHVIKAPEYLHATEKPNIRAVVNTTQSVDTVEPYMIEVPGVIENVIPIYPVRYGYANFFDELMPAQAPPLLPEIAAASCLNETGGYLLRLLREGWIYIKEEEGASDNQQVHIFRYCQTEIFPSVIEKFEKYYFTNGENAKDGLTLDTSSGATFYPFAFVTANTQKISIAYSEHEWAAEIIDRMNDDQEWRAKAMQQVDLSSPQTEFSQKATQENISALVEDYRNNDEKWLADKDSAKPMPHGLDLATTTLSYHLAAEGIVETMQKSHSEHKDGTLVALFDPVGRQRDIANWLRMTIAEGQAYQQNNLYPLTIGSYAKACMDSTVPELSKAAQENLDTQALTAFINQNQAEMDKVAKETQQWLQMMDYFVAGEGAKDEIGSLTFYLQHYFDVRQEGIVNPALELAKLMFLLGTLFEGVTASEEGMDTLDDWVGQAFMSEALTSEDNAVGTGFKIVERIFTQCHGGDWQQYISDVGNHVLSSMGTFLARMPIAFDYVGKQGGKWAKIAGNVGLENFYRTTFPSILDALLGLKVTGNRVQVPLDEVELLLKNQSNTGRAAAIWQKTKTSWHDRLIDWSEVKADAKEQRILQLLEFEPTASCPKIIKTMIDNLEKATKPASKTAVHISASVADAGFSAWSFFLNVGAMYEMGTQEEFAALDPLTNKHEFYRILKLTSTLSALAADSAALAQYGAKSTHATALTLNRGLNSIVIQKYLPTLSAKLADKLRLANVAAHSQHMGNTLSKLPIRGFVIVATVTSACSYGWDAYEASLSGNTGLRNANLMAAGFTLFMLGILYAGPVGGAVIFLVGMAGLLWSVSIISRYTKTGIENLLFRCFWGKSEDYSFWSFIDRKDTESVRQRLEIYWDRDLKATYFQYLSKALEIESQEFINYFYWPQLNVDNSMLKQDLLSGEQLRTFHFILPEFKMGISQLHGTMCNTFFSRTGTTSVVPNNQMTKTFKYALLASLNDPQKHQFKDDGLHLTVVATFPVTFGISPSLPVLKWCYEPEPSLLVPKRKLTSSGDIDGLMIGMIDERPNNTD